MGKKSQLKAHRRNEKIARVQRERDIADVFGADTYIDYHQRTEGKFFAAEDWNKSIFVTNPIIQGVFDGGASAEWINKIGSDFNNYDVLFDGLFCPFEKFWVNCPVSAYNYCGVFVDKSREHHAGLGVYVYAQGEIKALCDFYLGDDGRNCYIDSLEDAMSIALPLVILRVTVDILQASNIELVDKPPNLRLSAIAEREFGRPLTTYKVLKVNTSHKEYQGVDKDTGLKDFDPRRMHVVRGHHAEYGTNGRGLHFGKYARKVWIPAHVRGNEERGIVVKDYEVQA